MLNIKITKLVILAALPLIFTLAQDRNCINYTGGIGELETVFPDTTTFFNKETKQLAIGLFDFNTINPNYKLEFEIDKKIKASGFGSQKISIFKKEKLATSSPYLIMNIPGYDSLGIKKESRNFYPKIGDKVKASLKIKTSEKINNLRYQVRITARVYEEGIPNNTYHVTFAYFITSTPLSNWTDINFNFTIPSPPQPYQKLETIFYRIDFYFPSSTASSSGDFWFDKMDFFVERNDSCIQWPYPLSTSLKLFEVYGYEYPRDFINSFRNNSAHLGSYYTDLIIKNYDPNYKYFFYINLTPLTKYFYDSRRGWRERSINGEFNQYIDNIKIITSTGYCHEEMFPLNPKARYPEFLKLNKDIKNNYKLHGCLEGEYAGLMTNYSNSILADNFLKYILLSDSYFPNPNLKYDAIFFDNFMPHRSEISKQTPDNLSIQRKFLEFAHFIYQRVGGLFKYIGNWGYVPYISESDVLDTRFDMRNFYPLRNLYNGYLDEGWLWSPYSLLNNLLPDPKRVHLILKTVIENKKYDYILLIGAFKEGFCTSTDELTSFMISSFYLVNNSNVYFALRPLSLTEGIKKTYAKAQCYDSSMYLPLGKPLEVKTIEEMIITSTPNFVEGALYLRKYQKGLVLLNSSNSKTFKYQLTTYSPFNKYFDQLGNSYLVPTVINLKPQSGLILYGTEYVSE